MGQVRVLCVMVVGIMLFGVPWLIALHRAGDVAGPEFADTLTAPRMQQLLAAPGSRAERVSRSGARTTRHAAGAAGPLVDPRWVAGNAGKAGIPATAVRAYAVAQLRLAADDPGCRLGWTTLAGIGYIESGHGTGRGATLGTDGRSSPPILGPALDGSGHVAAIPSTPESIAWHGDPRWDHAVGPLQFIPSTWSRWASDGDGDGAEDPNDIDDAAYAAGRYLCADGHDLSTGRGWAAAIFSYNHAQAYVNSVYAAASSYAARTG